MCKGLILSMWVFFNVSNLSAQMLTSAKIKGLGNIVSTTSDVGNVGLNPSLMDTTHQISFQFNIQNSLFNQHLKYISGGVT
ncbi:MAG: hypothetical protein EOO99_03235 [Pedobacter sp.]|nr:MAG: hypothetical protein EOO99_03235 [Pedobacter sp.]